MPKTNRPLAATLVLVWLLPTIVAASVAWHVAAGHLEHGHPELGHHELGHQKLGHQEQGLHERGHREHRHHEELLQWAAHGHSHAAEGPAQTEPDHEHLATQLKPVSVHRPLDEMTTTTALVVGQNRDHPPFFSQNPPRPLKEPPSADGSLLLARLSILRI